MLEPDVQRAGSPEGKVNVKWAERGEMSWNLGRVPHRDKLTLGQELEKLQKDSGEDRTAVDPASAPHPGSG